MLQFQNVIAHQEQLVRNIIGLVILVYRLKPLEISAHLIMNAKR
jgi:hypothetical protein